MNDKEICADAEALLSRRAILKIIAGAPLVATFGLASSPLLRYLKPTMKAGDFLQSADLPKAERSDRFFWNDFPEPWICLPFELPIRYRVFNPEEYEIRYTPGFIMRTAKNEIVAFSRVCPNQPFHILNFCRNTAELDCIAQSKTPVLYCPCDCSTFDLNDNGRVLVAPESAWRLTPARPLRRMHVSFDGKCYTIDGIEPVEIQ